MHFNFDNAVALTGFAAAALDVKGEPAGCKAVNLCIRGGQMDNQITQGVLWGLLSAFTYAILSLMNRRFSSRYPATLVSLYEQGTATIVLLPTLFVLKPVITLADAGVLMMLGIIFTAVAHSLFISGLRTVKVRIAGILSGLEPVYGTLSAFLFLKEVPSFRECLGGVIILAAVFLSTLKPEEKASDAPA